MRGLGLAEPSYVCLLHFFHSAAVHLDALTQWWVVALLQRLGPHLVRVQGRPVAVVDGLKRPKEGKKMPGVKSLHQASRTNAKPTYIMGHSLQAIALLVQAAGGCRAVPLTARIHEGLRWSRRQQRTLIDKLGTDFLALPWAAALAVVADAYYAVGKLARRLLSAGHRLVTRAHTNAVAYFPPEPPKPRRPKRRGRPSTYGLKTHLRDWFNHARHFRRARSPVYGETGVWLRYYSYDLLWRPLAPTGPLRLGGPSHPRPLDPLVH